MAGGVRKALEVIFGISGKLNPSLGQSTDKAGKEMDKLAAKAKKVSEATKMRDLKSAYAELGKAGADVSKAWTGSPARSCAQGSKPRWLSAV